MHFNECGYWKPPARFLSHMNMPKAYYIGTKPKAQSDCVTILICFNGLIETPSFMLILGLLLLEIHKHSHTCTFVKDVISIFWCNTFSEMKWHFAQQFESVSREKKRKEIKDYVKVLFKTDNTLSYINNKNRTHTNTLSNEHWNLDSTFMFDRVKRRFFICDGERKVYEWEWKQATVHFKLKIIMLQLNWICVWLHANDCGAEWHLG